MLKKYMLIEVFSGSYNKENVEHELLNDQKSHITGKYPEPDSIIYGYIEHLLDGEKLEDDIIVLK
jgi:hypothetical protein